MVKKLSNIKIAREAKNRRFIALDENKISIKGSIAYISSAIDVDNKELLALEASYQRSELSALLFLRSVLRLCKNRPIVLIDRGP